MFEFILFLQLAVALLAAILWLWRREPRQLPEQPKQPSDEDAKSSAKPLEEADGRVSKADTFQRKTNESKDVHLRVEGEVVKNNRHSLPHLQLLLEDQVPELKGEIRSGSIQTVQDSAVLVRVSQTGKCICAPRADTRTRIATCNHTPGEYIRADVNRNWTHFRTYMYIGRVGGDSYSRRMTDK